MFYMFLQSYNARNKSWNTVNTISAMMEAKKIAEEDFEMLLGLLSATQGCP